MVSQIASASRLIDLSPVRDWLGALRSDQESLEELVIQLFGELDELREQRNHDQAEIETRRQELCQKLQEAQGNLAAQRTQSETDREQRQILQQRVDETERQRQFLEAELATTRFRADVLDQLLAKQKDQIERDQKQIENHRQELLLSNASLADDQTQSETEREQRQILRQRVDELERQRQFLEAELATMRSCADVMDQLLAKQKEQIERDQEQIETQRKELLSSDAKLTDHRMQSDADREQRQSLQERVWELERQRQDLEAELESTRSRADEMAQSVAEQREQMVEERSQWTVELRKLREVLDRQMRQSAARSDPERSRTDRAKAADPVLHSVLAQFETLAKGPVRRSGKGT